MPRVKQLTTDQRFQETLLEYRKRYNVETLDSPNDLANLNTMIRNQILVEKLQGVLDNISTAVEDIDLTQIKKILDSIVALSETNIALEKTLGIDRKTRKNEAAESIQEYLAGLRVRSLEWIEQRLIKIHCKKCNIMVGRISAVYETTAFEASFQCPQCNKKIVVKRQEKDIFFDIKPSDAEWRRSFPIEIEQPKRLSAPNNTTVDELVIGDDITEDIQYDS